MKKNVKRLLFKFLSCTLAFLLVIMTFPLSVFATEIQKQHSEEAESKLNAIKNIFEDVDRRDKNTKHFRLEDGSYTAVQYDVPVHYLDENGNWQDIDNTLSSSGNEYGTTNAKIKFAKKISGNENLFTLHDGNRKITMSLDGAIKKTVGTVTNTNTDFPADATQLQKMMTLDKLSSRILYANILDGVDLEYVVESVNIKENIIVKEKRDNYSYTFTIKLNNLDIALLEDGNINIFDPLTNEVVYSIPSPVVYDSNESFASKEDAYYTLIKNGNNSYNLMVTVNEGWMNADDRAFPVTVDPPIYTESGSTITDTYINSYSTTSTPYDLDYLYVGNTTQLYWKTSTLPTLPKNAYITNAEFSLKFIDYGIEDCEAYMGIFQVKTDWDKYLTWSQYKSTSNPRGTYDFDGYTDFNVLKFVNGGNDLTWVTWNVTEIVNNWYNGQPNYGLSVSDIRGYSARNLKFASNEYRISYRPKLVISYKDMKGVEDYWSYTSQNVGIAGTGNVNNATGELTFSIGTLSTNDSLFGYTPTLVYNQSLAGGYNKYFTAEVPYSLAIAGFGFKFSMNSSIVERTYTDDQNTTVTYYVWSDADGTEHYFIPYSDGKDGTVYKDEDGLQMTLTMTSSAYTIKDASGNSCTFTRKTSDTSTIKAGGILTQIADQSGNAVQFTCNENGRVTNIKVVPYGSAAITYFKIIHNSYGQVNRILNETTQEAAIFYYSSAYNGTSISPYNGGYLRKIVFAHQTGSTLLDNWADFMRNDTNAYITADGTATYEYDSSGRLITARDEVTDYQVTYTYTGDKVTSITEKSGATNSLTPGQTVGISYFTGYTEVRSSGTDDIYGNSDDIITRYNFDTEGRATSAYSTDSSYSMIYGASSGAYSQDQSSKNSIQVSSVVSDSAANYLLNGGFEKSTNLAYWNTSGSVSRSTSAKHSGKYGAIINGTSSSTGKLYQYVALESGDYTLSLNINTNNCSGATVKLIAKSTTNNAHEYIENIPVDEISASGDYAFASLNFNVPSSGEVYEIAVQITGKSSSSQSVWVDNIMLAKSVGVSSYSMINFGNFEKTSVNSSGTTLYTPSSFWTFSDTSNVSITTAGAPFNQSLKIVGNLTAARNAKQTIYNGISSTDKSEPKIYKIAGFGKGSGQMYNTSSRFALKVDVKYYSGTISGDTTKTFWFDFETSLTDWQFVSGSFDVCADGGVVESITVSCVYDYQKGTAYFDNITVVEVKDGSAESYTYYDNGMPKTYNNGGSKEWYYYADNNTSNNMTRKITSSNGLTDYSYDSKNRLIEEVYYQYTGTYDGNISSITLIPRSKITYTYNSYGLLTATTTRTVCYSGSTIVDTSPANVITTSTTYNTTSGSLTFGAITSETDSVGRVKRYFYDSKGLLYASINPDNQTGYVYTYDPLGNITMVQSATYNGTTPTAVDSDSSVGYTYNTQNSISEISTKTTQYQLQYDTWGNNIGIKVGNSTIVSSTYNSNNGKLKSMTYGNGVTVEYVYDKLDRVAEIWYTESTVSRYKAFTYEYDANGNMCKFNDIKNNIALRYKYDDQGRMVNIIESRGDTNASSVGTVYDEKSRIKSLSFSKDYRTGTTSSANLRLKYSYAYDDMDNISSFSASDGSTTYTITPSYDALQRIVSRSIKMSGSGTVTNNISYSYRGVNGNETLEIASYTSSVGSASYTWRYYYDSNGNIKQITNVYGTIIYQYQYDEQGQLTREDNQPLNQTIVYTYDKAGNITGKKVYDFTTNTTISGSPKSSYTYGYGTTNGWGDQLISFWGNTITYDQIGNPLNYYNGAKFTWSQGRFLSTAILDGHTISNVYNDEGIRLCKTVDGIVHNFTLNGSQIVSEDWVQNGVEYVLVYVYDENGSPIGVKYRTSSYASGTFDNYLFEKSLQGDIIAIYNTYGTKVVTYQYDAWGNCTVSGTSASTIGKLNSFRYRSYFYDQDLGLYYLNSRYYDSQTGRFINPDITDILNVDQGNINQFNMYSYCLNNPVNRIDESGNLSNKWKIGITLGILAVAATILIASGAGAPIGCAVLGAAHGAITGAAVGAATGAVTGAVSGAVQHRINTGSWKGAGKAAVNGAVQGAIDGAFTGAITGAISGGVNSKYCFVAGTVVLTSAGYVVIEQIRAGDHVWATDPDTGETELKQVVQTFENQTSELVHLTINGEEIITTPLHQFYAPQKGWTSAVDLRAGDILVLVNGEYVVLEKTQHEILELPITVYNFEVEDFHTYHVGKQGILVHNDCTSTKLGQQGEKAAGIKKNTETITVNGNKRIPDGLDNNMWVQEVKNVKSQSFTSQLRDEFTYASQNHLKMELYIRRSTYITKPLQKAIKSFGVVVRYIPGV